MKYYYVAFLMLIVRVILIISIIGIPIERYLCDNFEPFEDPFDWAWWKKEF